jgi:hypothetical protein
VAVHLRSDETAAYGFQHPDNGAAMTLKLDENDCPVVEVDQWVIDECSHPDDVMHLEALARELTRAVHHEADLYEAARKLYSEHYCKDIL